ncbi:hypothetical protein [Virgibacillus sp. SK37]|uniref:hypothetical protein n=1 Tax=Virgibacillus sp. SK37 TaxID=403957 RepID=UPI0004D0D028|nr:hypothetical protein [Virgibacillus sp. SK37]AIF45739.1 hypothetical protein X953_19885 [Virgibacillus sp. SK37]
MILNLNKTESAVLLFHMAMMRKSARNTFKRNKQGNSKEMLSSFDEIKNSLEEFMENQDEQAEEEKKKYEFHYNINEIIMLNGFIGSYTEKLEKTLSAAGQIVEEDRKQIDCLLTIKDRTGKLLNA